MFSIYIRVGSGTVIGVPIAFRAINYTNLSTVVAPPSLAEEGDLAYVDVSEGTKYVGSIIGSTFYPKGFYVYRSGVWTSDRDKLHEAFNELDMNIDDVEDQVLANDTDIANLQMEQVTQNLAISLNTAKVSNVTHTGEVTGSGVLTVDASAIYNKAIVSAASGMFALVGDSGVLKRVDLSDLIGGGGNTPLFPPAFLYVAQQVVQTLADLPAPIGNNIFLEDKLYIIDGELNTGIYTLVYGAKTQISGIGQNIAVLRSSTSGTVANPYIFIKSTTNLFLTKLEIIFEGTNQLGFEHIGDGTVTEGESFEMKEMNFLCFQPAGHNNRLGYIKDIRQGFVGTISFIGFENGIQCAGVWSGGFRVDDTIFILCSGVFFGSDPTDPVNFARRMSSNANITVPLGSIGYDFPETAFNFDGQYQLQNGNAAGDGVYVSDFTSGSPANHPIGNFKNNTGIDNTFPGMEWISLTDNVVSIAAQNVWYKVNISSATLKDVTWVSYLSGEITSETSNLIKASILTSISCTGKANDIVEVKLVKEDALAVQTDLIIKPITIKGSTSQGRAENVTIPTTASIVKFDKTSLWLRNTSGTSDVTVLAGTNLILGQK